MPRLSISSRSRLIANFYQYNLERTKNKIKVLVELAKEEEIFISNRHAKRILFNWFQTKACLILQK